MKSLLWWHKIINVGCNYTGFTMGGALLYGMHILANLNVTSSYDVRFNSTVEELN